MPVTLVVAFGKAAQEASPRKNLVVSLGAVST